MRHDLGRSFVSLLATGRHIESGGDTWVAGPDFQWRPRGADSFTGQALFSQSHTPDRPDLETEWDGRTLSDHALQMAWSHGTPHADWYLQGQDLGPEFRADNGFITQVGYREGYTEFGYTVRPQKAFFNRIRMFAINYADLEPSNDLLNRRISVGAGMDGRWNSFMRVELNLDDQRVGTELQQRFRPRLMLQASPSRAVNSIVLDSYLGQEIDYDRSPPAASSASTSTSSCVPTPACAGSMSTIRAAAPDACSRRTSSVCGRPGRSTRRASSG